MRFPWNMAGFSSRHPQNAEDEVANKTCIFPDIEVTYNASPFREEPLPDISTETGKARHLNEMTRLQSQLADADLNQEILEKDNAELRHTLNIAQAQILQLEDRITQLTSEHGGRHAETLTMASTAHIEIADEFRMLVAQEIYHLAHISAVDSFRSPTHVPHAVAGLCRSLFDPRCPCEQAVYKVLGLDSPVPEERITQLYLSVQNLWDHAESTGDAYGWDFTFRPGVTLDPTRQEAWSACDPHHPAGFLVAPAYKVAGRIYALQQVYTQADQ